MRKNPAIHLDGFEELNKALRSVGAKAGGMALAKAALAGAEVIAAEAIERAPEDEGDLKAGIGTRLARSQEGRAIAEAGTGRAEWHGKLVELGTSKAPPKPFLRPALEARAADAARAVEASLRETLKDVL
jgi:HK97 gp10 family phage protein